MSLPDLKEVRSEEPLSNAFVCRKSDNVFFAIEKCLDNGLGSCFVVEDDERLAGRITLAGIRAAILDGTALADPTLARHMVPAHLRNDPSEHDVLQAIVDSAGHLTGIRIDRSTQPIQLAKPDLSHREFRSLLDAFISSWISSRGPYVREFEQTFSSYVGTTHGVAVTNGTVALHLALVALGVGPGDEVIVPDLTFAATINAVIYCGATPVIIDVDADTGCMLAKDVAAAITPRTKAVVPVHLYGRPAEIEPIVKLAHEHGIFVVEDCAEAHGATYNGRMVGQFGDISCFSFYANKIVTTGEGGMCLTNSAGYDQTLRHLRDHGMSADRSYWHERVGYNYRLTNLQAAIGHSQLWRIEETLRRHEQIQAQYREALCGIPGVQFAQPMGSEYQPVVWLACVRVPAGRRDALIAAAQEAHVEMRPFFHCLSTLPPYMQYGRHCPNSRALSATGVNLPTSRDVDDAVIGRVADIFRSVLS
jgi:perosamine synthetase